MFVRPIDRDASELVRYAALHPSDGRIGEERIQPARDVGVTPGAEGQAQDAGDEPAARLAAGPGNAIHFDQDVGGNGDRSLSQSHWYSFWYYQY